MSEKLRDFVLDPPADLNHAEKCATLTILLHEYANPDRAGGGIQAYVDDLRVTLAMPERTFKRGLAGAVAKGYVDRRRIGSQPSEYRLTERL